MREPAKVSRLPRRGETIIDNWPAEEGAALRASIDAGTDAIMAATEPLKVIAEAVRDTLTFIRKWSPWAIAAVVAGWPTANKIISELPPFPQ